MFIVGLNVPCCTSKSTLVYGIPTCIPQALLKSENPGERMEVEGRK
jgi:hypothetical protein